MVDTVSKLIKNPQDYFAQFTSLKEQFKQLMRFDIHDPTTDRKQWADRFNAFLADCNEAAYTHHLRSREQELQRVAHSGILAPAVQAKGLIQELPSARKQYFFFHSHVATAAQECRDGAKMGEIVAHLGAADVSLQKLCEFDLRLNSFVQKFAA